MSTFVVQCFYLLCNRVRPVVSFPVNVNFFLADTECRALLRNIWVVAAFITGLMGMPGGVCRYASAHRCKTMHLLEGLKRF